MTLTYTYDGASLTHNIAPTSLAIGSRADRGNIEEGGLAIEDPDGDLTLTGLRPFVIEESDCAQPRLYTGYVAGRDIGRSYSATQVLGATARVHEATLYDLNAAFMFRLITGADGKRPEETWDARLAWLVASDYLADFITGDVNCLSMARNMEATDYRYRYPMDVCNDLLDRTMDVTNYYLYWDPDANAGAGGVSLFFDRTDVTTYQSTIKISNVNGDQDGTTVFAPDAEAKLHRDPDTVYSGVVVEYADNQRVFMTRDATATAFIQRETSIRRPYTGRSTTATAQAQGWLQAHAAETDRITCTIRVPRSAVGLVTAGCAMEVKFSHLPGYSSYTWARVAFCRPKPVDDYARVYDLELELVAQREGASTSGVGCNTPGAWTASLANGATVTAYVNNGQTPSTPSNATDGTGSRSDYGSGVWTGAAGTYYRGWQVDLAATYEIASLVMAHDSGAGNGTLGGRATYLAYSTDGSTWTTVANAFTLIATWAATGWALGTDSSPWEWAPASAVEARYLRLWQPITHTGLTFYSGANLVELLIEGCTPLTATVAVDLTGSTVTSETPTPTPDGATTLFTLEHAYLPGTLRLSVDGTPQDATESNPADGEFTLPFAPYAGESVRATYTVG